MHGTAENCIAILPLLLHRSTSQLQPGHHHYTQTAATKKQQRPLSNSSSAAACLHSNVNETTTPAMQQRPRSVLLQPKSRQNNSIHNPAAAAPRACTTRSTKFQNTQLNSSSTARLHGKVHERVAVLAPLLHQRRRVRDPGHGQRHANVLLAPGYSLAEGGDQAGVHRARPDLLQHRLAAGFALLRLSRQTSD